MISHVNFLKKKSFTVRITLLYLNIELGQSPHPISGLLQISDWPFNSWNSINSRKDLDRIAPTVF